MSQIFGPIPPPSISPNNDSSTETSSVDRSARGVKAVYLHCVGDRKVLGLPKYTEVTISDSHVIFTRERPTDISTNMKLPILTRKTGYVDPRWANKEGGVDYASSKNPMSNRKAVFLNLRANPKNSNSWGWADISKWDTIIGTVLVARKDKKDITAHQVEALARFCFYDLQTAIEYQMEKCSEIEKRSDQIKDRENFARDFMCQARFEQCFEKLKAEMIADGDASWADVISPYSQV